jgi:acetyltransferase
VERPAWTALVPRRVTTITGEDYRVRRLERADKQLYAEFLRALSPADQRLRFFFGFDKPSARLLDLLTRVDHVRHEALAALAGEPGTEGTIAGVAHLVLDQEGGAEFAIAVRTAVKGHGLGYSLMLLLIDEAKRRGVRLLYGDVMRENYRMRQICEELEFEPSESLQGRNFVRFIREIRGDVPPKLDSPAVGA